MVCWYRVASQGLFLPVKRGDNVVGVHLTFLIHLYLFIIKKVGVEHIMAMQSIHAYTEVNNFKDRKSCIHVYRKHCIEEKVLFTSKFCPEKEMLVSMCWNA